MSDVVASWMLQRSGIVVFDLQAYMSKYPDLAVILYMKNTISYYNRSNLPSSLFV